MKVQLHFPFGDYQIEKTKDYRICFNQNNETLLTTMLLQQNRNLFTQKGVEFINFWLLATNQLVILVLELKVFRN